MECDSGSPLRRLQLWRLSQCNGDWEHTYGIRINTLDNPGWEVAVDVKDTDLYGVPFNVVDVQREEDDDWLYCKVEKGTFVAACGPLNLEEAIDAFLSWAGENDKDN